MLAVKHVDAQGGPRSEAELGSESAAVGAALAAWRRKAADILMTATAVVHLPAVIIVALGHGPALGSLARAVAFAAYLLMAAGAVLRRVRRRKRLLIVFLAYYLVTAAANLAALRGPYAQVGLVVYPVLVLVLLGAPAARIAVLASATILVSAPFLRVLPVVVRMLGTPTSRLADATGVVWMQAAGLAAFLVAVMIVLDRFHQFLLDTLGAQGRAMAERQRLEREIAKIGDTERRRLGQELHDGACQQFTAALLHCQVLRRRVQSGEVLSDNDFQAVSSLLSEGIGEARNIARGLCPLDHDPEALASALRALTTQIQMMGTVRCEFMAAGDVRVPDPAMAQHLYRIAQEALSNAVHHAHASRIAIELRRSDSDMILLVEDDGAGLPQERPADGMGLRTMTYRAQILEGELTVGAAPGGGTRVTCRVPRSSGALATGHHA